jgi:lipopolysaccharide transport system ATP-binding protein
MSDIAIEVDSVWKKFHRGEFHDSLRDFIPALARRVLGRGPKRDELAEGDFWALKDVSFQVRQGEVLGIIGANGAGKSTLLKILSKILKPNRGQIRVNGRLRALIEVAAGFHPDLTGRENVYLNGSILGMKKREIDAKFDEIVEFAGIGEFLDTPVKRYSSGMHARLGFAVAAHLEPEILIVDEVLAVGDQAFQKKCLGKMSQVGRSGRTVLFVSHNMAAVQELCGRAILLERGRVVYDASAINTVDQHLARMRDTIAAVPLAKRTDRKGTGRVRITGLRVESPRGESPIVRSGESIAIALDYEASADVRNVDVGISIHNDLGATLTVIYASYVDGAFETIPERGMFRCVIDRLPFVPGHYTIGARVVENGVEADWPNDRIGFIDVEDGDFYRKGHARSHMNTSVFLDGMWSVSTLPPAVGPASM